MPITMISMESNSITSLNTQIKTFAILDLVALKNATKLFFYCNNYWFLF